MVSELPTDWLPTYTRIPLLTPGECATIIAETPRESLLPATRVSGSDPSQFVVDEDYRIALTRKYVAGDPIYELLLTRVVQWLPQINASFGFQLHPEPHRLLPSIMINRYDAAGEKPGHHGWHTDTSGHPLTQERKLSIVLTLSPQEAYAGGELQLLDGNIEFPLADVTEGIGAVFHGLTLHRVLPIIDGTRYSCVLWLMGPRFQ